MSKLPVGYERETLAACGLLLLQAPDTDTLQALDLNAANLEEYRQAFYDRLCIPQSGIYLPAYQQVFRNASQDQDGVWHFPPPDYRGGRGVEMMYEQFGFEHHGLPVDPFFQGPQVPGDHLGLMLIFLGWVWDAPREDLVAGKKLSLFVGKFLGDWVDRYLVLLPAGQSSPYLDAIARSLGEAIDAVRESPVLTQDFGGVVHSDQSQAIADTV